MAGRNLSDWYPDWRIPKDIPPKVQKIGTPRDLNERQEMNWAIYNRGPYSGTDKIDVWKDHTYNAYSVSNNSFVKVNPMETMGIQQVIFGKYSKDAESQFVRKFGAKSTQVAEDLGLSQALFEDSAQLIPELNKLRDSLSFHTNKDGGGVSSLMASYKKAIEQGDKGVDELKKLKKAFEDFSVGLQQIADYGEKTDAVAGEALLKQMRSGNNFETASKSLIPFEMAQSLQVDKSSYTSAANLIKTGKKLQEQVEKIDASTGKLPKLYSRADVSLPKIASSNRKNGPAYRASSRSMNWDKVAPRMVNMMTNYFGLAFEVATAVTLENAMGELLEGVKLLGASSGGKFVGPNGMQLTNRTSKTDVQAVLKNGVSINFSNKHQKHMPKQYTKAYDGSLFEIITTVLDTLEERETLYAGMMNDKFWSKASSMNEFISSLLVDRAVGGLGETRVDFMLYQDEVMALPAYYASLDRAYMEMNSKAFRKFTKNPKTKAIEGTAGIGIKVHVL